ncbi:MAG: 6,7-dimethyl-8-ribityllumazine synthase [Candidatus Gracilibacteria bacterium]|nr:6,7-dimethyl-8-ribityllumazine synthase [Candidatus Gracilibacteria bacterium]
MSTYEQTLKDITNIPKKIKIAFVVAEFNKEYTSQLELLNIGYLNKQGFKNVESYYVPGAFEIPGATKRLLATEEFDLIITLGAVIRGETPHFDYVCNETSRGIMNLTLEYETPIIFGVLTCNTEEQVKERIKPNYAISGLNLLSEMYKIFSM